ncbi:MAG: NADH-quinone oxidoreductase subunit M [Vampirovibrionales bacterium]|nr:NADH-quinone oxidoreductase subunit M [Vampirovibrionales bacterium]
MFLDTLLPPGSPFAKLMHQTYLLKLILFPILMSIIIALLPKRFEKSMHGIATVASVFLVILSLFGFAYADQYPVFNVDWTWLPQIGIHFSLATDGISQTMVALTAVLMLMAVVASYDAIQHRLKLYYSMLFLLIASLMGVFVARDTFVFFLFYELELIPMYLLIAIWGGPRRQFAATKFVLYTLFGSVFLFAGILAAAYFAQQSNAIATSQTFLFSTLEVMAQGGLMALPAQLLVFSLLFIGFCVKLPVVPLHTWLPDAHVEAPTPISMLLAGILLKLGAYGMLRLCFGLLPAAAAFMAPYIGLLALVNIVYAAAVALVQTDMKKLVAYSSVSHMGFVLLGLASLNAVGLSGATFVMISHGIVSAALFMCVGTLYIRTHSRAIADYGGFAAKTPVLFYFFLFTAMASLGLPLLISFAGESLVFYGAYLSHAFQQIVLPGFTLKWSIQLITALSGLGVVLGAAYLLWMIKRVFGGVFPEKWAALQDANKPELFVLGTLTALTLLFGFAPNLLTERYSLALQNLARPVELALSRNLLSQTPVSSTPASQASTPVMAKALKD